MIPEYAEEVAAADQVWVALYHLADEDDIWDCNLHIFSRMNMRNRILWWRHAKRQAQLGVPAMQTLLLKVIELKLTGGTPCQDSG